MSSKVSNEEAMPADLKKESRFHKIIPESVKPYASTILKWAVAGYLIRILAMPLFAHEDVLSNAWMAFTLIQKHQMYTFYPLPAYLLFASFYALFSPFLSGTLATAISSNTAYWPVPLLHFFNISQPGIQVFLFVSKMPMLIFDFALGFLLLRMIDDGKKAVLAFKLWMLCPISIFISYFFGQFDVIPTFFVMLGLYFFKIQRIKWSMVSVGLSAAFKPLGLLFVPPLMLIHMKQRGGLTSKAKQVLLMLGISILPLLLSKSASLVVPVYYESANTALLGKFEVNGFWGSTYYARSQVINPLFTEFLYTSSSTDTVVSGIFPYLLPAMYSLFLFAVAYLRKLSPERASIIALLIFYLLSSFHPQWFLWILPLLIIMAVEYRGLFAYLYVLFIPLYFISISVWNGAFTSHLLSPIVYQAYYWPGPIDLLNNVHIPAYQTIDIFRSILSAMFLACMILALRPNKANP